METASIFLAFIVLTGASPAGPHTAAQKVGFIENGQVAPGSRIFFSSAELNAFMRDEAKSRVPGGVRDLHFSLGMGRATGYGVIDFIKLRQAATGEPPGWIMKNLFSGERPVTVTARLSSQNGRARVDVERVEVSGIPVSGTALDLLIEDYLKPTFPSAKISEWFAMGYQLDRLSLSPAGMTVVVRR